MYLTETHNIRKSNKLWKEIDNLSFLSKNLFNSALYAVRQHYFSNKEYLNYNGVNRLFIDNNQQDYTKLPRKVSNHVLQQVDKSFKSFFKLITMKNELNGKPKIPHYKHKTKGRNILSYEIGAISIREYRNGFIKLSGTNIKIPFINKSKGPIKEIRIVPCLISYKIEIIYEMVEKPMKSNNNKIAIDLGVNNVCSITNNIKEKYLIINGKPLKSINQFYNKKLAEFKSELPLNIYSSQKIKKLTNKRNNKIKCEIHKISKKIVNYCDFHDISTIIVGYNSEWKQECDMGKKNNQNFISIPYLELLNMLKYKARLSGIDMILTEESYTSKCSFFDKEEMTHHNKYVGRRVKRGLFKTKTGLKINADINGSLNIMRKVVPEFVVDEGDRGFAVNPKKVTYLVAS
jgi:putative transposase